MGGGSSGLVAIAIAGPWLQRERERRGRKWSPMVVLFGEYKNGDRESNGERYRDQVMEKEGGSIGEREPREKCFVMEREDGGGWQSTKGRGEERGERLGS
jgi:hypothetical protein